MKYIFNTVYPVSQKFLEKNAAYMSGYHMGTDFACPVGTEIHAPFSGSIIKSEKNHPQMGNYIFFKCIKDNQAYTLRFMHLSACLPVGDYLEGEVIAISGNTGASTGPHLHVDVTRGEFNIKNLYTYEGVAANLVDFEEWCPAEYHTKPTEVAVAAKTAGVSITKESVVSFFNTFVTIFITVAIPQLSTFDFENATKASIIALGGSIFRMVLKSLVEKYTKNIKK